MNISFSEDAWAHFLYWQSQNKKTLKKVITLLKDIGRNPFNGIGKPELLKGNWSGYWSRRIDDENRIVYYICNDHLEIVQCKGHYEDK